MIAYISELNALVAEDNSRLAELKRQSNEATRARLTPLQDRLTQFLKTIPVELQREGLSLASIQTSLRGRWRGNCHPGELGISMRRLGFKRKRQWHGEGGFKALWYLR